MKKPAFAEKGSNGKRAEACDFRCIAKIYTNIGYTEFTYRMGFPTISGKRTC